VLPWLESVQADFGAALIDPALALPLARRELAAHAHAAQRLGLYRANVVAAAQKALAHAYPVLRALVGGEFFAALARAYARAQPSVSGDLNRFGAGLGTFVAGFEHTQALPYLADVATLEWTVHRAYYAADAPLVTRARVTTLPPAALLSTRFGLHPACAWIESEFPLARIWLAHQPGSGVALPADMQDGEIALVARPLWRVQVLRSSRGEIAALRQLKAGLDMEAVIAAGLEADPRFDFPRALVRWFDHGILVEPD
jgi:hypothetical protein